MVRNFVQAVGEGVKNLAFDLKLPLGPYKVGLDRGGRHAVLAGASGHLALMDWPRYHLMCEVQVKETTHDTCILHNEQFFAAAQKKYVYIYDRTGAEVHCCRDHLEPAALDFMPHHFLLASCSKRGVFCTAVLCCCPCIGAGEKLIHMTATKCQQIRGTCPCASGNCMPVPKQAHTQCLKHSSVFNLCHHVLGTSYVVYQ